VGVVTVDVVYRNRTPVANHDAFATPRGVALAGNVLANDTDVEGDPLTATRMVDPQTATIMTQSPWAGPRFGGLTLNADGSFLYTPAPGFVGTDWFHYYVSDPTSGLHRGEGNDHRPAEQPDGGGRERDAAAGVVCHRGAAGGGRLGRDVMSFFVATGPAHGTAVLSFNGTADSGDDLFVYWAEEGYVGADSFTYGVSDGHGGVATATVYVAIVGAGLDASPVTPGKMDLVVVGTAGADTVRLSRASRGRLGVSVNGGPMELFAVSGAVRVFGLGGDDVIDALGVSAKYVAELRGGDGNDVLIGGAAGTCCSAGTGMTCCAAAADAICSPADAAPTSCTARAAPTS
jgi:hypothetical protein